MKDTVDLWQHRWENWTDEQLKHVVTPPPGKPARQAATIIDYIRPKVTVDIGGGCGLLGKYLPGKYYVVDHPRVEQFVQYGTFLPLGSELPPSDLTVNSNCWGETALRVVTADLARVNSEWLYIWNRELRQVNFEDYPLDDWEPVVKRKVDIYIEFLGRRK